MDNLFINKPKNVACLQEHAVKMFVLIQAAFNMNFYISS